VRSFVNCGRCGKPRCVYSPKALTGERKAQLDNLRTSWKFYCGDDVPDNSPLKEVISVEAGIDCRSDVSPHYYIPNSKYPEVCYKCGRSDIQMQDTDKSQFSSFHPVCNICRYTGGHEPRTRKRHAPAAATTPASQKQKTESHVACINSTQPH
jgi:hypothetical protein